RPAVGREIPELKEPIREAARPPTREPIPDKAIVTERPLPTLKELLPPVGWSAEGRVGGANGPVRLDTRDPQYVTYFNSIKRAIEVVWQYPELALRYGLQGRLLLEFSILGNGDIESAKIVRSSGSNLLDEEALRAVKAAAPFGPIPPWIGKNRIDIVASFEYLDNRLNYRFMRYTVGNCCAIETYSTPTCAGSHLRIGFLAALASSRRLTGVECGAVLPISGFSLASWAIECIASTNASNVSGVSVSVGSIISAPETTKGK